MGIPRKITESGMLARVFLKLWSMGFTMNKEKW